MTIEIEDTIQDIRTTGVVDSSTEGARTDGGDCTDVAVPMVWTTQPCGTVALLRPSSLVLEAFLDQEIPGCLPPSLGEESMFIHIQQVPLCAVTRYCRCRHAGLPVLRAVVRE